MSDSPGPYGMTWQAATIVMIPIVAVMEARDAINATLVDLDALVRF